MTIDPVCSMHAHKSLAVAILMPSLWIFLLPILLVATNMAEHWSPIPASVLVAVVLLLIYPAIVLWSIGSLRPVPLFDDGAASCGRRKTRYRSSSNLDFARQDTPCLQVEIAQHLEWGHFRRAREDRRIVGDLRGEERRRGDVRVGVAGSPEIRNGPSIP